MKSDFFCVAFSHYMNITIVYKLCDAQIEEEIMKEFFVIHSITHHPTRKKKRPDRQKTIHNFSAAVPYTLLLIFYHHLIFLMDSKVDSANELNVMAVTVWFSSDPSKGCSQSTLTRGDILTTV